MNRRLQAVGLLAASADPRLNPAADSTVNQKKTSEQRLNQPNKGPLLTGRRAAMQRARRSRV